MVIVKNSALRLRPSRVGALLPMVISALASSACRQFIEVGSSKSEVDSTPVTQIAAAGDYTCALRESGAVFCWGTLAPGGRSRLVPERQPLLGQARKIVLGGGAEGSHACALLVDDTLWCWGRALESTLQTAPLMMASDVRDVWAGHEHTCAVNDDDFVTCWGDGVSTQPSRLGRFLSPTAVFVLRKQLHTVAGGQLWRENGAPGAFQDVVGGVMQIAASSTDWCAITLSAPTSWTVECDDEAVTPTIKKGQRPIQVAVSEHRACVLVDTIEERHEEETSCEMSSKRPCLPRPATRTTSVSCTGEDPQVKEATALSLGDNHACVLHADGSVWCWGDNSQAQLGNGSKSITAELSKVEWPDQE